jgi:hypothetical protein
MTIIGEGISTVKAFALPAGVNCDGSANPIAGMAIVKWHSAHGDMLHQVYVNGIFAGATVEPGQRQLVVPVPLSQKTAVRIEVFAVEPKFADIDFSDELAVRQTQAGRVRIEFARTDNLPADGRADFYLDDNKLNKRAIKIQTAYQDKGGLGLGCFGSGDFGFDGSASPGFGKGNFGLGWFGFDACLLCWQSSQLEAGNYKFNVKITDGAGNTTQPVETEMITVIPPARPAKSLAAESFDRQSGKLVLKTG